MTRLHDLSSAARPGTIVLDLRCLQDPNYARRGVGRHALALLRHAPRDRGFRVIGLVDHALPRLIDEAHAMVDDLCPNAYAALHAARMQPVSCFVAFSPMTHDPLFFGRLLADSRLVRAAVVHDFIPHRCPERYLPGLADRLSYAGALRWLSRYDAFMPNSQSTAEDLRKILGVPGSAIAVTGCSLDAAFETVANTAGGGRNRHVLVVGGGDPRKNPDVVVRAHARSAVMQRAIGMKLVVAGGYGENDAQVFREMAASCGGRPELVEVPGHLSEEELLALYGRAAVVVCPSRDEGFSIPVIEAMAAGVPCLASDIPAQRELVEDESQRFAPDDDAALTAALDRAVTDAAWRETILARQASVWPRFRAEEVGRRFWDAVLDRLDAPSRRVVQAPFLQRGARPRVALLSPLPPDRSGVADYTAATCIDLGRLVDLHVFTETERPGRIPGAASIRPLTALPHLLPEFDRVISVVGNSHFHTRIMDLLRRYGAACIAHDARMLGFYAILRGRQEALALASRELGRPVTNEELDRWLGDEGMLEALFLGEIAESAAPMIVHSQVTARLVQERHGITPVYIPFSIYRPCSPSELTPDARAAARARLGLPKGEIVIATFGLIAANKAPEECVWALDMLRGWGIPASLHFVGATDTMPHDAADLRRLVAGLGLDAHVHFVASNYVPEQMYRDYLIGADLGIQLRTYGLGGLSGAVLDCAAAGLPTVTNAGLGEAVGVPGGYFRAIPDALSPVLLAEALAGLLEEAGLAAPRIEAERHAYSQSRSFHTYARLLCDALALDLSARPDQRRYA